MRLTAILLLCVASAAADEQTELQRSVEDERGGRHWIDQPTDPPRTVEESRGCFEIEPGCRIEVVAAEPLVFDPVWIDFDHRGRMFVAEYADYPVGPDDANAPPLSRIVLLTDHNGDGVMDERTVYADQLDFCHSFLPLNDGILACTQTEILFLRDTDGDDVADVRDVWFDGFTPAHPQMQIGCPQRGFDNRIWLTYGPGNVRCRRPGFESDEAVTLPRTDFCFDPRTMAFESVTGLGQFGNTIDNEGRRFFCTNRNPIMMEVLPRTLLQQHPLTGLSTGHTNVGPSGEQTRVYPRVEMKSNWLAHAGTHTSACGVSACRSARFDRSFQNSVFVCEPVGHLVTRSIVEPQGAALTARRARDRADFLTSTDTWFRPASLRTGPDGALYLADMYRLWVEHPKFVPPDVAERMDWRAGERHGRIWRIVPAPSASDTRTTDTSAGLPTAVDSGDPVALLRSSNGWRRDLGQRLIVEQNRTDLQDAVRELLFDADVSEYCRLQALWTLDGLQQLTARDLQQAATDAAGCVRRDAVMLLARRFPDHAATVECLAAHTQDPHAETQLQALLGLAQTSGDAPVTAIIPALQAPQSDRWLRAAALMAASGREPDVLESLIAIALTEGSWETGVIRQFTAAAAAAARAESLDALLQLTATTLPGPDGLTAAMLAGLEDGLRRNRTSGMPRSFRQLADKPPAAAGDALRRIRDDVALASRRVIDSSRNVSQRLADIALLPFLPADAVTATCATLLSPGQAAEIQQAAFQVLRDHGNADNVTVVLDRWERLTPGVKTAALDWLLSRKDTLPLVLQKMSTQAIPAAAVSLDQRMKLLRHPDAAIRAASVELFGGAVSANRRQVAEDYAAAVTLPGSAERGHAVFRKTCARCHRIGGEGHHVGPDISDTRNRSRDALLYDILDPNRRIDPQFGEYVVVTVDGQVLHGLLVSESADEIVLRQPEAKQHSLLRSEIEELRSTEKSLMPEGVEKDISVQQMADLLEFLKSG